MKIQYDGIKYPFQTEDNDLYLFDLNKTERDSIRSKIMHIIFTPKGQKIRDPEFGSDLIKYIFDENNEKTWDGIKNEINRTVPKYVENVNIDDINILKEEEDKDIFVRIDYSVKDGNVVTKDSVITRL